MPFLCVKVLIFQGSAHQNGVGSLSYIINSFIMVEKHRYGQVYESRLSNGPIESINNRLIGYGLSAYTL